MARCAYLLGLILVASAATAEPAPDPPPGAGVAEWKFRRFVELEWTIVRDGWRVHDCGIRSRRWVVGMILDMKAENDVIIHRLAGELRDDQKAQRFGMYGAALNQWLITQHPAPTNDRAECEAALDRITEVEAEGAKWSYR
jgi:hypothetical protein